MLTVDRNILEHASCVLFDFSHSGAVYRGCLNDFGGSYHSKVISITKFGRVRGDRGIRRSIAS